MGSLRVSPSTRIDGLVSTIIPVHNRPVLLGEAVASVLAQTYRPIEIIIVDDGSSDETPRVADALAAAHPDVIRTTRTPNGGPGVAREAGRRLVRGEFVQYLDSDDVLLSRKFELQVAGLRANPLCGVSYGKTRFGRRGAAPAFEAWKRTGERITSLFPSMLQSRWWGTSTPLYRGALVHAAGPWQDMSAEEDWEYDCRIARHDVRLHFCDAPVSHEHDHPGPRLSRGGLFQPSKLRDRARAHDLIFQHAQAAGIGSQAPEMKHFARELFLLARQCGAAGLPGDAKRLYQLAREASGPARASGLDFAIYRAVAGILGWSLAGRLACGLDTLRR